MALKAVSISIWESSLDKVKNSGDGFVSLCPCHSDKNPSFLFKEDTSSTFGISFKCLAGCESVIMIEVLQELGLLQSDGNGGGLKKHNDPVPPEFNGMKLATIHTYRGNEGEVLFYVGRYESGDKKQTVPFAIKPDEEWKWWKAGLGQYKKGGRPLYNLHRIAKANEVFFVEGEKCADRLGQIGVVATTCVGGSSASSLADFMPLKGRTVYVWRDKDEPGAKWEYEVKGKLKELNIAYKVVDASKIKGQIK